jgi:hypothetical protein
MGVQTLYDWRENAWAAAAAPLGASSLLARGPVIRRFFAPSSLLLNAAPVPQSGSHWVLPNSKIVTECAGNR